VFNVLALFVSCNRGEKLIRAQSTYSTWRHYCIITKI